MRVANITTLVLIFSFCAVPARAAQSIQLEFRDGRVWLVAVDAPVREILAEWARLRGASIVNTDALPAARVTLELAEVPERQALHVILRNAPGYILTSSADSDGSAAFERILILPKGATPVPLVQAEAAPASDAEDEPDDSLPEPLAALMRSRLTGVMDPDDAENAERDAELPEALVQMIQAATGAVTPKSTASSGSPKVRR